MIIYPNAKINIGLNITEKRTDGFHNIETVFERISLFDTLKLKENNLHRVRIFCKHPDVPADKTNLCFKAVQLLRAEFRLKQGVDITLIKRIPVAAGLGGGSGNAAFVLLGLNKLWHLRLKKDGLLKLAAKLGSDVAFFVSGERFALGRGRGEIISGIKGVRPLWHILVAPRLKLSTRRVYQGLNLRLTKKRDNVNILIHALSKNSASQVAKYLRNDLERAAFRIQPSLLKIKNSLKMSGIGDISLSGSGAALFGVVGCQEEAENLKKEIKNKLEAEVFAVKTW